MKQMLFSTLIGIALASSAGIAQAGTVSASPGFLANGISWFLTFFAADPAPQPDGMGSPTIHNK
ncbi:hypothetical protein [Dyella humicola]|uniref:hypothetical protein n=1 Tax=Dyella humicola TaxID=2992126 RepID=UPI002257298C|nr:hypothetical protein [Dyella humicola]